MREQFGNLVGAIAVVACFFIVPFNADAAVYKCTDASGKVNYSDHPCDANTKALTIVESGTTTGGAGAGSAKCDQLLDETHRLISGPDHTAFKTQIKIKQLNKEYELRCLGVSSPARSTTDSKPFRGPIQCPDGSFVTGSQCVMTPNGKFIGN